MSSTKKRSLGTHTCTEPNCNKQFTRLEHLKRHKLNHNPKFIYKCNWGNCTKTFVRKDLNDRHYRRHEINQQRLEQKLVEREKENEETGDLLGTGLSGVYNTATISDDAPTTSTMGGNTADMKVNENTDWINWLFNDELNTLGQEFFTSIDTSIDFLSNPIMQQPLPQLGLATDTTPRQVMITEKNIIDFKSLIPNCNDAYLNTEVLTKFMRSYWLVFNAQYPILHYPTFDTQEQQPLLLLCMLCIGGCFLECFNSPSVSNQCLIDLSDINFGELFEFCKQIAGPVRWLLFQHEDFNTPIKTWLLQALALLEFYEKTSSDRKLHERSHIYHGIIISLLRRCSTLGGNPEKEGQIIKPRHGHSPGQSRKEYLKWIEQESMKRITYLAFIIDCHDSVKFGHQMNLFSYQMQLSLPCDERIWNSDNINDIIKYENESGQRSFISYLKSVLINNEFLNGVKSLSLFNKKTLLSGLISIIYQLQQIEIQNNFLRLNGENFENLKRKNFAIIDKLTLINESVDQSINKKLASVPFDYAGYNDNIMYHMTHLSLTISHYDIYIYCGAPIRMNVKVNVNDYDIVEKRITDWINSTNGGIAIIHCYLILWEFLLDGNDAPKSYIADQDPYKNYHCIGISVLVLWCYNFHICGNESNYLNQIGETTKRQELIELEDGYEYVIRIKNQFKQLLKTDDLKKDLTYERVIEYSKFLPRIINKKNMVGLCKLVSESLLGSKNELNVENGKLIHSIGERSMGRQFIKCNDMYNN